MSILGATLPPAGHRNQNATRPKEKPSFLLGFPADSVDAEVEGNLGPEKGRCLLEGARPNHPWTAGSSPLAHGTKATQEVRESGKSGAWWAGLRSDWLVLGLRAGTQ